MVPGAMEKGSGRNVRVASQFSLVWESPIHFSPCMVQLKAAGVVVR